jgi:hypothetical protein
MVPGEKYRHRFCSITRKKKPKSEKTWEKTEYVCKAGIGLIIYIMKRRRRRRKRKRSMRLRQLAVLGALQISLTRPLYRTCVSALYQM